MKHMKMHVKVKKSTCTICEEENKSVEDLKTHMKAYHSEHNDLGDSLQLTVEADSDYTSCILNDSLCEPR